MTTTRARCAVVWVAVTAVSWWLATSLLAPAAAGPRFDTAVGSSDFAPLLVAGCAAVALTTLGWLWVATTVVVLDACRGVTRHRPGVPPVVRRVTVALCGAALASGTVGGPALAAGSDNRPDTAPVLAGLRLPERVDVSASAPVQPPAQVQPPHRRDDVVVQVGDTLWELTAGWLGPEASEAETARRWPELYALNRDEIGPDPDVLKPGMHLVLPTAGEGGQDR